MEAAAGVLVRSCSGPVVHTSPRPSLSDHDFSSTGGKKCIVRSSSSVHLGMKKKKKECTSQSIRRTRSETDVIRSDNKLSSSFFVDYGSPSFPARIPEEEEDLCDESAAAVVVVGALILKRRGLNVDAFDHVGTTKTWRESEAVVLGDEEREYYSGGGIGKGRNVGGGGGGGGEEEGGGIAGMSAHYESLLKANPGNPLILRNYGRFLHEVARDLVKAEECYERAILASPGDGEVLSLYGKLIWESYKDGDRAESYFDQAVQSSPDDCYVMGSYAKFLWDAAEDDDEDEEETSEIKAMASAAAALVEAC